MYSKVTLWTKGGHKIVGSVFGAEQSDLDERIAALGRSEQRANDVIYLLEGPDAPPIVVRADRVEAWQVLQVVEQQEVIEDEDDPD